MAVGLIFNRIAGGYALIEGKADDVVGGKGEGEGTLWSAWSSWGRFCIRTSSSRAFPAIHKLTMP